MRDGENSDLLRVWREPVGDGSPGVVVHAAGEIDLLTVPGLAGELTDVEKHLPAPGPLVLDLTEVGFLASAGLSVLVGHHESCRNAGIELRIATGNRTVARTIHMTGLSGELAVFDSLAEALAAQRP